MVLSYETRSFPFQLLPARQQAPSRLASKGLLPLSTWPLFHRQKNLAIGNVEMEDSQPAQDEFFGEVSIYTQPLFVQVPLPELPRWLTADR